MNEARVSAVLAAVETYATRNESEDAARTALIAALTTQANPFDRHANATHVTASAIVTGPRGTLLHLHLRAHKWLQPGGHIDDDELPEPLPRFSVPTIDGRPSDVESAHPP